MTNIQVDIPANIPHSNQTLGDNALRIVLSYAGWLTIYFGTGWISKLLIPQVRTLKPKEQLFWQLAMVRAVAGLLSLWAAYIIFIDGRITRDIVVASTDESWTFICVLSAFFVFEEITLIYFDIKYRTFSKELHIHHFLGSFGFLACAYYGRSHYFAIRTIILEGSTPFSCICWCLLKLKLERTKVWKINQWILINVFHLRTVYELLFWYEVYHDWNNIKQNLAWPALAVLLGGYFLLTFWLTPYWTYKKTVQFFYPTDWNAEIERKKKDEIDKTS